MTLLGVGAILYSLVTFFSEPPRSISDDVQVVRLDESHPEARRHSPGRAKRPTLRPYRPTDHELHDDELPPRAGEIPVSAELAKDPVSKAPANEVAAAVDSQAPAAEEAASAAPAAPVADHGKVESDDEADNNSENNDENNTDSNTNDDTSLKALPVTAEQNNAASAPAQPVATASQPAAESDRYAPSAPAVTVAAPRPDWVDAPPGLSSGVYTISVPSGRYVSVPECQRALDEAMQHSVDYYINEYLGQDDAANLVGISLAYIKHNLKKDEYAEIVQSESVGPMHQLHARLEFDDRARADFQRQWRNAVVQHRLLYTGGGAVLVLALLSTLYGYLKLDLKTDGAHKGRLQLAATLVALIVAAGVLLARHAISF